MWKMTSIGMCGECELYTDIDEYQLCEDCSVL